MAEASPSTGPGPGRERKGEWRRSAETRKAVLDAARKLFNENGYDNTSIQDVVTASGASVGSIYHQFGGKTEVFRALLDSSLERHKSLSEEARRNAVASGESDPLRIYVAGARAYLMDTWNHRDIDRVSFHEGLPDAVTGRRELLARYLHGSEGIDIGHPPLPDSASYALHGLLTAAARQLIEVSDPEIAEAVVQYFCDLILTMAGRQP